MPLMPPLLLDAHTRACLQYTVQYNTNSGCTLGVFARAIFRSWSAHCSADQDQTQTHTRARAMQTRQHPTTARRMARRGTGRGPDDASSGQNQCHGERCHVARRLSKKKDTQKVHTHACEHTHTDTRTLGKTAGWWWMPRDGVRKGSSSPLQV